MPYAADRPRPANSAQSFMRVSRQNYRPEWQNWRENGAGVYWAGRKGGWAGWSVVGGSGRPEQYVLDLCRCLLRRYRGADIIARVEHVASIAGYVLR
jgi:hypothetical protein